MNARWFAPVKNPQEALEAVKLAYQATLVLAGAQAIFLLLHMWFGGQWGRNLFFLLFLIGIGWALKTRQSRTAAIALLLDGVQNWFSTFAALVAAPFTWFGGLIIVLSVLLICAGYKAAQGTFGYHRLSGTSVIVPNLVRLCLVTSLYVLLYSGALVPLWAVGKNVEWLSQVLSSTIGLVWLVPVVLICFLGGFRLLPGTKKLAVISTSPALPTEPEKPRGYISPSVPI